MSLRRLVKRVGKTVKRVAIKAAPLASVALPGIGGIIAGVVGSALERKVAPAEYSIEPELLPAPMPQTTTGSDPLAAPARLLRASRRMQWRERVAPNQFDAITPLDEAQAAARPPMESRQVQRFAPAQAGASMRSPKARTITGANQVSIAAQLPRVIRAGQSLLTRIRQSPFGVAAQMGAGAAVGTGLVSLPGAGFTTGGRFGSTPSGAYYGPGMRRRRRMNPTNVRALRRSLRRVESFVKLEKRVDKIVNRLSRSRGRANRSGFVRRRR